MKKIAYVPVVVLALTACHTSRPIERVDDRVTVGLLLPLSGKLRVYGERAQDAAELAADSKDSKIRIVVRDTAGGAAGAVDALVLQDGASAIIGPLFRDEALPASERAQALARSRPRSTLEDRTNARLQGRSALLFLARSPPAWCSLRGRVGFVVSCGPRSCRRVGWPFRGVWFGPRRFEASVPVAGLAIVLGAFPWVGPRSTCAHLAPPLPEERPLRSRPSVDGPTGAVVDPPYDPGARNAYPPKEVIEKNEPPLLTYEEEQKSA